MTRFGEQLDTTNLLHPAHAGPRPGRNAFFFRTDGPPYVQTRCEICGILITVSGCDTVRDLDRRVDSHVCGQAEESQPAEVPARGMLDVERGWAPCVHNEGESSALTARGYFITGASIDTLVHELRAMGGDDLRLLVDQWWAVSLRGAIYIDEDTDDVPYATYIQGDTLLLALTETAHRWQARNLAVTGRAWKW